MDESAPIRAIVIGVSVLLAIATISGVLMYYNTAKQLASNVGRGQDFAANYEQSIQDILLTGTPNVTGNNNYITGADVKNLLNYFYNDENVQIDVINLKYWESYNAYNTTTQVMSRSNANLDNNYESVINLIIDNQKFNIEVTREDNIVKYIKLSGI